MKDFINKHKDWIMTQDRLDLMSKEGIYLHCLPADRGHEVTDEVIEGPRSAVWTKQEERIHAKKANSHFSDGHNSTVLEVSSEMLGRNNIENENRMARAWTFSKIARRFSFILRYIMHHMRDGSLSDQDHK